MRSLLLVSALALSSLSLAVGLSLGDKAPPMKVATVVKGQAVNLDKGLHVVEFWATWCGPCKVSIPHLTEMAKKYKGKVDFTGVSVWENGEDQLGQVKKFVAAMGPKMDYNVAFDGPAKAMDMGYMKASGSNGIPTAFLVKDGKVIWIGHPMDGLDTTIDKVLAGNYDLQAAKAEADQKAAAAAEMQKKQAEMQKLFTPVMEAMKSGNIEDALAALDKLDAEHPEVKLQTTSLRFTLLLQSSSPKMLDFAKTVVAGDLKDNAQALNSFAWAIIDPEAKIGPRNYAAALIIAEQAAKASDMKDGMILDTYALALFKTGDMKKAIETQTKAVELSKTDKNVDEATLKEMKARLEEFKKAPVT